MSPESEMGDREAQSSFSEVQVPDRWAGCCAHSGTEKQNQEHLKECRVRRQLTAFSFLNTVDLGSNKTHMNNLQLHPPSFSSGV